MIFSKTTLFLWLDKRKLHLVRQDGTSTKVGWRGLVRMAVMQRVHDPVLQLHSLQQMTVPYAKSSCHSPATMWASDMLKDQTISLNNQRCLKYCFLRQAFAVAWICCQTGWSKALIQTVILSNGLSWNTAQTSEWINPADSGDFLDISTSATVRVQGVICWQQTAVLHGLHRNFLLKIYSKSTKTMDCQENLQKRKVICGTVMDLIAIALSLWSSVNIKS